MNTMSCPTIPAEINTFTCVAAAAGGCLHIRLAGTLGAQAAQEARRELDALVVRDAGGQVRVDVAELRPSAGAVGILLRWLGRLEAYSADVVVTGAEVLPSTAARLALGRGRVPAARRGRP